MHILGLIGGVACGKSAVAAALERRGAVVLRGDEFGHLVLAETDVRDELVARWGRGVLAADGMISRPAVAKIVFAPTPEGAAERQFLEQLTHPRIRHRMEAAIRQLPDASVPAIVIDAALLIEAGWSSICTAIAFVDCPRDERLRRAQTRGWSAEEFSRREAAQLPIEEKKLRATHIIDNSGSLADLDREIDRLWTSLAV
jgi:dephospho-CoA kinase